MNVCKLEFLARVQIDGFEKFSACQCTMWFTCKQELVVCSLSEDLVWWCSEVFSGSATPSTICLKPGNMAPCISALEKEI